MERVCSACATRGGRRWECEECGASCCQHQVTRTEGERVCFSCLMRTHIVNRGDDEPVL